MFSGTPGPNPKGKGDVPQKMSIKANAFLVSLDTILGEPVTAVAIYSCKLHELNS